MAVNLLGTAAVVRAALPHLERAAAGSSPWPRRSGFRAVGDATAYCASKFGVVGFTRALAVETAGRVGVTLLVPGGMRTAFFDGRDRAVQARRPTPAQPTRRTWPRRCSSPCASRPACELRELVVPPSPAEPSWPLSPRAPADAARRCAPSGSATCSPRCPRCARCAARSPSHRRVLAAPARARAARPRCGRGRRGASTRGAARAAGRRPQHARPLAVNLHGRGPREPRRAAGRRAPAAGRLRHPDVPESAARARVARRRARGRALVPAAARRAGSRPTPRASTCRRRPGRPPAARRARRSCTRARASPARRWPAERWAAVARAERAARPARARHGRRRASVALAREVAARRRAGAPAPCSPGGRTSRAGARWWPPPARVVCGDTGRRAPRHGARHALGACSSGRRRRPAGVRRPAPRHRVLWAGRRGDPHGHEPDPGLLLLTPADVRGALDALEADPAAAPRAPRARAARRRSRRTNGGALSAPSAPDQASRATAGAGAAAWATGRRVHTDHRAAPSGRRRPAGLPAPGRWGTVAPCASSSSGPRATWARACCARSRDEPRSRRSSASPAGARRSTGPKTTWVEADVAERRPRAAVPRRGRRRAPRLADPALARPRR